MWYPRPDGSLTFLEWYRDRAEQAVGIRRSKAERGLSNTR